MHPAESFGHTATSSVCCEDAEALLLGGTTRSVSKRGLTDPGVTFDEEGTTAATTCLFQSVDQYR